MTGPIAYARARVLEGMLPDHAAQEAAVEYRLDELEASRVAEALCCGGSLTERGEAMGYTAVTGSAFLGSLQGEPVSLSPPSVSECCGCSNENCEEDTK